jgi:tellurite resistance protein TerB
MEEMNMPADDKRHHPDLRSELAGWHDEEASLQIDTIAAACALIAYADGVVRQAEHDSMVRSLSRFGLLDEQSRQELLAAFEQATERFEIDFGVGEAAALATVARLRKSGRFSHVLVETCRALGESDGDYVLEEQAALVKICRRLGLEPVGAGTFAAARR